jgi:glycosyltransferase involved in cell wall biosynthesis
MKQPLSVIIISGNAEKDIERCLRSCLFAREIILVAANSTDKTVSIVKKIYPQIKVATTFDAYNTNFTKWRNLGYALATQPWILYVDTDEKVTVELQNEITKIIHQKTQSNSYYVIPRRNHFLNHPVTHGGTYPDYVKRLYQSSKFKGYTGILHEEPIVEGTLGYLSYPLLHFTHQSLHSMLDKSLVWTDMEAKALQQDNHPPVVWWRFPRMMLTKLFERLIVQNMWRDGIVGWISVIFEVFDTYMIYARLYELQKNNA